MALGTTGISTTLVANTIGEGSNDVGTLCTSNKINAWSKWKPVSYQTLGSLTLDQLKETNYGLTTTPVTNPDNLTEWLYTQPSGGSSSPYRLGDFRNYNHAATAVFSPVPDIDANKLDSDTCRIDFMYNIGGSSDLIGLSDFINLPIGALYLAVLLNDGTNTYIKTSSTDINNGASYIEFPITTGYFQNFIGKLNAKFVLCSLPFTSLTPLSSATGNTYYPFLVGNVSEATCIINVMNSINLVMLATKISVSPKILYSNIETFITTPANPDALYFGTTNGEMYLLISATNTSNAAVAVGNHFALKATPSITGTTSGIVSCQLYDASGNTADSITVPANSSAEFRIGSPNILFMNNNMLYRPTETVQIQSTILPYYNGNSVNIAIDGPINISN